MEKNNWILWANLSWLPCSSGDTEGQKCREKKEWQKHSKENGKNWKMLTVMVT